MNIMDDEKEKAISILYTITISIALTSFILGVLIGTMF